MRVWILRNSLERFWEDGNVMPRWRSAMEGGGFQKQSTWLRFFGPYLIEYGFNRRA